MLVSLPGLVADGLLEPAEIEGALTQGGDTVEFGRVIPVKHALLELAASRFLLGGADPEYAVFRKTSWLADFALFAALKAEHRGASWTDWDAGLGARREPDLQRAGRRLAAKVERHAAIQYLFDRQWSELAQRCRSLGIGLIGDLPIYLALDSADIWARPELVQLGNDFAPRVVGGVPPDYYTRFGQLWGNPIYRWEEMAADGFTWWASRLRHACARFDLVRLDHFRGFAAYWEVAPDAPDAVNGRWVPGPGLRFFEAMRSSLGGLPLVAEDLGFMTDDVHELRATLGLPGMRVAQFGFGPEPGAKLHHPANYPEDVVAYTATHDSDTTQGWFWKANPRHDRRRLRGGPRRMTRELGIDGTEVHWDLAGLVWESAAGVAMMPAQDLLGLGSEARMNVPGEPRGNWRWRLARPVTEVTWQRMRQLTVGSGRDR
jgi:4-alpha-glucanotransferase